MTVDGITPVDVSQFFFSSEAATKVLGWFPPLRMSAAEAEERNNARADAIFDVFDSKSGGVSGIRETVRIAGDLLHRRNASHA